MTIRKTGFEKADRYTEALEELQAEADRPKGFEASEIAVRAASLDGSYMAARRFMNRVFAHIGVDRSETPTRPPFLMYGRAETSVSLKLLKSAGVIESGFAAPPLSGMFGPPDEDPDARVIYRLKSIAEDPTSDESQSVFRPACILHDPLEPRIDGFDPPVM